MHVFGNYNKKWLGFVKVVDEHTGKQESLYFELASLDKAAEMAYLASYEGRPEGHTNDEPAEHLGRLSLHRIVRINSRIAFSRGYEGNQPYVRAWRPAPEETAPICTDHEAAQSDITAIAQEEHDPVIQSA